MFGQIRKDTPLGTTNSSTPPEQCYVKFTVKSTEFMVAKRTSTPQGSCKINLEVGLEVTMKCVCTKDPKPTFKWMDPAGAGCRATGSNYATYDFFEAELFQPAQGTCPPGTCKGETPPFHRTFRTPIQNVTCDKNICEVVANAGGMRTHILKSLGNQLKLAYGTRPIKCPKEGDTLKF